MSGTLDLLILALATYGAVSLKPTQVIWLGAIALALWV